MICAFETHAPPPERIAILTTSYPAFPGDPAGHFVESEARALCDAGSDVHVLAPGSASDSGRSPRVTRLGDGGAFGWPGALARLRERPARALGAAGFAWRALRALRHHGPYERLVAHFLLPCAWPVATRACALGYVRHLELVGHGSDVRLFARLPRALRRRITRAWLEHQARIRVVSAELAEGLVSATSAELGARIAIAPSPIELGRVPSRLDARAALGIDAGAKLVVIVGRLIAEKRVASALAALRLVTEARVVVVGDGPLGRELARAYPWAQFTGTVPRSLALTWIAAADVLVSASRAEGAPSAVREARLLGVPVVAYPAGDLERWATSDAGIVLLTRPCKR